jgi:type 1 glutamine amidotransferase
MLAGAACGLMLAGAACGHGGRAADGGPADASGSREDSGSVDQPNDAAADDGPDGAIDILAFSRTTGFRHGSIEPAVEAMRAMSTERGWRFEHTEDPTRFGDRELAAVDVVVFLLTTGDVLDDAQQGALERWHRRGRGWVGVHSASDTEYDWPWYGRLVGAYFASHPAIQSATVRVASADHPSTAHLPAAWTREDEWYDFRTNPRGKVDVLLTVDESTYEGGGMGKDHPIAWSQIVDGGRSIYTALGHTDASWSEPDFLAHVAGSIAWAAGERRHSKGSRR